MLCVLIDIISTNVFKFVSEVYILHKINFFPCCKIFYFFPLLVFSSKEGDKWKNIFKTLYFIHIIPPPTYSFSFFHQKGEKNGKKRGGAEVTLFETNHKNKGTRPKNELQPCFFRTTISFILLV